VAGFLATLGILGSVGSGARIIGEPHDLSDGASIRVVRTSEELFALWTRQGGRGRRLVHASRFLHFVPAADDNWFDGLDAFPIATFDLPARYERSVDARNLLWVSLRSGVARAVYHVLPSEVMDEKLSQLGRPTNRAGGEPRKIVATDNGSPRVISERLPDFEEPALLSIDASYLRDRDVSEVVEEVRLSRLRTDLVVLCRSEDNPDVTEASRVRLDELATKLPGTAR
jgi:hypothetical protein